MCTATIIVGHERRQYKWEIKKSLNSCSAMDTCRAYALCKLAMEPIHFFLLCCCRMIGYIVQPLFIVGRDCLPARRLESIRIVQLPYNCSIRSTLITASSMLDRFFFCFVVPSQRFAFRVKTYNFEALMTCYS